MNGITCNHHNYSIGYQHFPLKERFQEKGNEIHISDEPDEISFLASQSSLSMDNYNERQMQKSSSNDQCLLEVKSERDYQRCIWCINFNSQFERKGQQLLTPSLKSGWRVQEFCGDECLDFFISAQTKSSNQISNNINSRNKSNINMQKLPSLSEMVEQIKNEHKYREFHEPKDEWLIDQEMME